MIFFYLTKPNIFSLIFILLFTTLIIGCTPTAPLRPFNDFDLLIQLKDMPNGWEGAEISKTDPNNSEGAENIALRNFSYTNTSLFVKAGETVYRYRNEFYGARNYSIFEKEYFTQSSTDLTPWKTPDNITISYSSADKWRFSCADKNFSPAPSFGHQRTICQYLGQYKEFIIYFSITIKADGDEIISSNDLTLLLNKIDERVSNYLNQKITEVP